MYICYYHTQWFLNVPWGYLIRSGCYSGRHLNTYHQDLSLIRKRRRIKVTISHPNPVALTHFLKVPLLPEITCTGSCEHQVRDCIQCLLMHVIYNFQWQRQDTEILLFQLKSTNITKTAEITSASKAYSISSKLQPSHSNLFFKRVKKP